MIFNHPTCFVRKEVYKSFGLFNEEYRVAMDYELLLRFYVSSKVEFVYIPELLANMRYGGESDKNMMLSFKESMRATISYGYPKYLAYFIYFFKVFKAVLKNKLGKTGKILQFYRKLSPRKKIMKK